MEKKLSKEDKKWLEEKRMRCMEMAITIMGSSNPVVSTSQEISVENVAERIENWVTR